MSPQQRCTVQSFSANELISHFSQNYTAVTFRNVNVFLTAADHLTSAVQTFSTGSEIAWSQTLAPPPPVMERQCLCIHWHCLGSSTPPGCEQRKLHVNVLVWRLDRPERTAMKKPTKCAGEGNVSDKHVCNDECALMQSNEQHFKVPWNLKVLPPGTRRQLLIRMDASRDLKWP